jgi:hypothetical protein
MQLANSVHQRVISLNMPFMETGATAGLMAYFVRKHRNRTDQYDIIALGRKS